MTEVYVFDRGEGELPPELLRHLPRWRREKGERLRRPEARQESLSAGIILGYAMEKRGIAPEEPVTWRPAGKPVFANRAEWFSLSHSGRYAMCALGESAVGADVQEMRRVKLSIARRFHPREQAWLEQLSPEERPEAFFRLWARKEAWVKAVSDEKMRALSEVDVIHPLPEYQFRDYALPFGYRAAVCARGELPPAPILVTRERLLELWR